MKKQLLALNQCKITSAYKEPRSSGNPEVSQTHLAILLNKAYRKAIPLDLFNNSVVALS